MDARNEECCCWKGEKVFLGKSKTIYVDSPYDSQPSVHSIRTYKEGARDGIATKLSTQKYIIRNQGRHTGRMAPAIIRLRHPAIDFDEY